MQITEPATMLASSEIQPILSHYGFSAVDCLLETLASGLINTTYRLTDQQNNRRYILQAINRRIFSRPEDIAANIRRVATHLQVHHPHYCFPAPIRTMDGQEMACSDQGSCYRLFPFLEGSRTLEVADTPGQAYEAARQFAGFTRRLKGLNPKELHPILPDFHNLDSRFRQFTAALEQGQPERRKSANALISYLLGQRSVVDQYRQMIGDPAVKLRVMHFDTKISNVLFDHQNRGLAVIDLDTIMPGYFFDDVGDMLRTYLSPASEEEPDLAKVYPRVSFFEAVEAGYLSEMGDELTATERRHFAWSGRFMTYMQALRFLTDYLLGDPYYSIRYPEHNLSRAANQVALYQQL